MANTITQWKPQVTVDGKTTVCKTYAEIKKSIYTLLNESDDKILTISRSRRGEWGEWFEKWGIYNGKPVKLKEGWM